MELASHALFAPIQADLLILTGAQSWANNQPFFSIPHWVPFDSHTSLNTVVFHQ